MESASTILRKTKKNCELKTFKLSQHNRIDTYHQHKFQADTLYTSQTNISCSQNLVVYFDVVDTFLLRASTSEVEKQQLQCGFHNAGSDSAI